MKDRRVRDPYVDRRSGEDRRRCMTLFTGKAEEWNEEKLRTEDSK